MTSGTNRRITRRLFSWVLVGSSPTRDGPRPEGVGRGDGYGGVGGETGTGGWGGETGTGGSGEGRRVRDG